MIFRVKRQFILVLLIIPSVLLAFSGGTGTASDPFQITTATQLDSVRYYCGVKNSAKCFKLINDIDLTIFLSPGNIGYNNGLFWLPIGDDTSKFYGRFEGGHHKITGIKINRPSSSYIGVFGCIGNSSRLTNIGVEIKSGDTIIGKSYVGGLVGCNDTGFVSNSFALIKITGYGFVGGLIGFNSGTVNTSFAKGSVSKNTSENSGWIGGLTGANTGILTDCFAICSVTGDAGVGGLVGLNGGYSYTIHCYATGPVVGGTNNVGGLIGLNSSGGQITGCYWDKERSGIDSSSGSTTSYGLITQYMKSTFKEWDFKATWTITGTRNGGYPSLRWQEVDVFSGGDGSVSNPFQITTAGQLDSVRYCCGIPDSGLCFKLMNDIDLRVLLSTGNSGYNNGALWYPIGDRFNKFRGKFDGSSHKITGLQINRPDSNYVGLFSYIGTGGKIENITIETQPRAMVRGKIYVGALAGINDSGIVSGANTIGNVTGQMSIGGLIGKNNGQISSSLFAGIVGDSNTVGGLVGDNAGMIYNCSATCTTNVAAYSPQHIGGLVGTNSGTISLCYTSGIINAGGKFPHEIGGLIGSNGGIVEYCNSMCDVDGYTNVGGLLGSNGGKVNNSYATGRVNGIKDIGGLVGGNGTNIDKCYATGIVIGMYNIGGLIGFNFPSYPNLQDTIKNCYAFGDVFGTTCVGGLIGKNDGVIDTCYSIGFIKGSDSLGGIVGKNDTFITTNSQIVGIVCNSYWDTQVSGQLVSSGSVNSFAKTTAEMNEQSTFVGWQFQNVWAIEKNKNFGYPYFQWQLIVPYSPPVLISPSNNAVNISLTPNFIWHKFADDNHYSLQISTEPDFSAILVNETSILDTAFTIGNGILSSSTTYYWRVAATKRDGAVTTFTRPRSFTTTNQFSVIIRPGWNLISLNVQPADSSVHAVFDSIRGFVLAKNNSGLVYWPAYNINNFDSLITGSGYKVYTDSLDTLRIFGLPINISTTSITLCKGWNMISYFPQTNVPINIALSSVVSQLSLVKDNSGQVYMPELGINTIGDMQVGQGYKVYMKNPAVLKYSISSLPKEYKEKNKEHKFHQPVHYLCKGNTGNNAIILFNQVTIESTLVPDNTEIGAFDEQGNLVGNGVVIKGKSAVCVWGDDFQTKEKDGCIDGEKVTFRLWNGTEEFSADYQGIESLKYREDGISIASISVIGRVIKSFELQALSANPFKKQITISFDVPAASDNNAQNVEINIYNLSGRLIQRLINGKYSAGRYYITWGANNDALFGSSMYIMQMKADNYNKKLKLFHMK